MQTVGDHRIFLLEPLDFIMGLFHQSFELGQLSFDALMLGVKRLKQFFAWCFGALDSIGHSPIPSI